MPSFVYIDAVRIELGPMSKLRDNEAVEYIYASEKTSRTLQSRDFHRRMSEKGRHRWLDAYDIALVT